MILRFLSLGDWRQDIFHRGLSGFGIPLTLGPLVLGPTVAPPGFSLIASQSYKVGGAADLSLPNLALVFAVVLVYCARG